MVRCLPALRVKSRSGWTCRSSGVTTAKTGEAHRGWWTKSTGLSPTRLTQGASGSPLGSSTSVDEHFFFFGAPQARFFFPSPLSGHIRALKPRGRPLRPRNQLLERKPDGFLEEKVGPIPTLDRVFWVALYLPYTIQGSPIPALDRK